jgi:DNA-binding transcriptional LysR family regulator
MDSFARMRIFVRVVEDGSFSAAGRNLGVAPSSISRQIGELEDDLGVRLFHRTTRKLSLTEGGRSYHLSAAKIIADVEEARLAVADAGAAPSGILRLTVPASAAIDHIVPAITKFQGRFPAVQFVLSVTDRMADMVDEGLDLAIRVGRQQDSSLVARKVGAAPRLVCASPAYLKRAGTPATPADLEAHDCLTFRTQPGSNLWSFAGRRGRSDVRASGPLVADDAAALAAAAAAGMGIVLLPEWLVGRELAARRLRVILADYRPLPDTTPIYAVYPHQRHLPTKVRAFSDFLAERFGRPDYSWGRMK